MIQLAKQLNCFENIHSIPGIGELTTAMIIGEIGDITRYQSGRTHSRDTITKNDNKREKTFILGGYEYY